MKRLLYFMIMAAVMLTGCTKWDEPITENYGDGPSIEVSITAMEPTDSAFTVTITPGKGTTYYAFVMDANDEAEELNATTLLKGGYGNAVVNTKEYPTLSIPVTGMEPNTTYQVYAVASNDKGIVGKIAVASIKTTDSGKPNIQKATVDAAEKKATVEFDQVISRGEGKVTAVYYSEFDFATPVAIDEVEVTVDGNSATFAAPSAPAGSYLMFSWEKGAFVDAVGNECAGFTSTLNEAGETVDDIFKDAIWVRVKTEEWTITDDCFTAPKVGGTFPSWKTFEGEITFENKVYVLEDDVKTGDFTVTYSNENRTVTYKLPVENINFGLGEDLGTNKVIFKLPEATQPGDKVTVAIKEGVFYDVNGNTNAAYSSSNVYWIAFSMTKDDVLGTFDYYVTLNSNGKTYNLGSFTISEYTGEDAEDGDVVISGLYLGEDANDIYGYYDIENCKVYIYRYQALGTYEDEGETYGVLTYSMGGNKLIEFNVTPNGITSTDFALVYSDAEYTELKGYEIPAGTTIFHKAAAAEAPKAVKSTVNKKSSIKWPKGLPKKIKQIRKK